MARAGESIEDYCRACKLDRMHTVIAADPNGVPIRVACGYCSSEHNYRGGPRMHVSTERDERDSPASAEGSAERRSLGGGSSALRPISTKSRRAPPGSMESAALPQSSANAKGPRLQCLFLQTNPTFELYLRRIIARRGRRHGRGARPRNGEAAPWC